MKLPAGRVDGFLRSPDPQVSVALVYGPDQGLVRERCSALVEAVTGSRDDPFRVAKLSAPAVAREPGTLIDEAAAQALTGGRRAVLLRDAADGLAAAVKAVLEHPRAEALTIVEAGELTPRSPLRRLCESAANAVTLPCYEADAAAMGQRLAADLGTAGLSLDGDAEQYLVQRLLGDRQVARREVEKLIAYMGGSGRVTVDDARACIGDSAEQTLDELALSVADGDLAGLDRGLARLTAEGVSPVAMLRAVQRYFDRLHRAAGRIAAGASVEQAMAGMRLFFKVEPRFRRQLGRWRVDTLGQALGRLLEAEIACKQTGAPAELICGRTLMQIASLVRR